MIHVRLTSETAAWKCSIKKVFLKILSNSQMSNERLQREGQFHCKNYLLEMPRSHAKIRLHHKN